MKMKKFMALILAGAMVMGMAACGSGKEEDTKKEAASAEAGAVEGEISITVSYTHLRECGIIKIYK